MAETKYEEFIRSRITDLRLRKNVSEHKMSLDLDNIRFAEQAFFQSLSLFATQKSSSLYTREPFSQKVAEFVHINSLLVTV